MGEPGPPGRYSQDTVDRGIIIRNGFRGVEGRGVACAHAKASQSGGARSPASRQRGNRRMSTFLCDEDYVQGDPLLHRFFEVFLFEDLPASDRRADNVYLAEVDRCGIYVGQQCQRPGHALRRST